jgi:hypothetical protein
MKAPNAHEEEREYIINLLSKQFVVDHFFLLRKNPWGIRVLTLTIKTFFFK